MNGHQKELEHIDKILGLFTSILDDSKLCSKVFTEARVRNNFEEIIGTIKNSIKPKILKQIARKTIKEKLDVTAQNFQVVSYALLNSLLIITEGNVNFQLSLDPELLRKGCIQTGNPHSWLFSEQPHNITEVNPLREFLIKGYAAINKIAKDVRVYSKLDITIPSIHDIKYYISNGGYYKIEDTFSYYSNKSSDSDTYNCVSIHNDQSLLRKRAEFIYSLSLLALKLINASYVIENVLDLISFNNENWVFNSQESANLEKYFEDISNETQKYAVVFQEFLDNYKMTKHSRANHIASTNELIKYIKLASSLISNELTPRKDLLELKQAEYVQDHKMNYVKGETLYIVNEQLFRISYRKNELDKEMYEQEKQIFKILSLFLNLDLDRSTILKLKKYFHIISNQEFKEKYLSPKVEGISPFYKILFRYCGFECNDKNLAITGVKNNKHDNFYLNIIMNLQSVFNETIPSVEKYGTVYKVCDVSLQHLDYLQQNFFGFFIQKEVVREKLAIELPERLNRIYYRDYLALKELDIKRENSDMRASLEKSSKRNLELNELLKTHIRELALLKDHHEQAKLKLEQAVLEYNKQEQTIEAHESVRVKLEQNLIQLLNAQTSGIDECYLEVENLSKLSCAIKEIISSNQDLASNQFIMSIYDVIIALRERMKIKVSNLSENAKSVVDAFNELSQNHQIITEALKARAESFLSSHKEISAKIEEIIRKLDEQSSLLNGLTQSLTKAQEETEQVLAEEANHRSKTKRNKPVNHEPEIKLDYEVEIPMIIPNISRRDAPSDNNNIFLSLSNSFSSYLLHASSYWFFYFRQCYKKYKCIKLFESILNDHSLLFEHKLIILNTIINKITSDANYQDFNTGKLSCVIGNVSSYSNQSISDIKIEAGNDSDLNEKLDGYIADFENEVNSSIFYDLIFSNRKYF